MQYCPVCFVLGSLDIIMTDINPNQRVVHSDPACAGLMARLSGIDRVVVFKGGYPYADFTATTIVGVDAIAEITEADGLFSMSKREE